MSGWFQDEPYLSMELRIISSLRIQAVRASFFGLRQQALVEVPDDRVEAAGYQRSHVEGCADPGPSTPDGAFAPQGTTVPVEGSHAHQGSDLPAVESAQFGQVCQKGKGDLVSDARYAAQQVVLLPPYRTLAEGLAQALVQVVQLLLEPGDVGLDAGPDGHGSTGEAVPLRYQHGHHLVSAGHQRAEDLGLGVPEGTPGRTDGLGEVSQDRRIQGIGFGQPPSGLGKVPPGEG